MLQEQIDELKLQELERQETIDAYNERIKVAKKELASITKARKQLEKLDGELSGQASVSI